MSPESRVPRIGQPAGTWLSLYEYSTQADTTRDDHFEGSSSYDYYATGANGSTRDVNDISRTTHDVWEGSKLTLGYCTVSEEGVKISGELGSITRTTEVHNQGKQQDWTNVLTRQGQSYTKTGSSTDTSLCTESPTVHSRSITNDLQETVSSSGHTTTRTTHGSQVWSSDGQTGTRQIEWLHTLVVDGGQLITVGSSSSTEAWSPGSNVTITGTEPTGQPTAPTYTGPDDQHFDDLVAALLDHAQDLADQVQNATLTPASRAALVDAAILSFTLLDADPSGQNGGEVYEYCATPPESGGQGSGDQASWDDVMGLLEECVLGPVGHHPFPFSRLIEAFQGAGLLNEEAYYLGLGYYSGPTEPRHGLGPYGGVTTAQYNKRAFELFQEYAKANGITKAKPATPAQLRDLIENYLVPGRDRKMSL